MTATTKSLVGRVIKFLICIGIPKLQFFFSLGRGKKKKLKQLIPIFALLQLKIQSLIPLFLGIIAFAAVKGLLLAKAALFASALLLLKKLLSKHDHHESYEVVAHPHHDEHYSHGGGHGGWGRSQDAQDLAYNAYST